MTGKHQVRLGAVQECVAQLGAADGPPPGDRVGGVLGEALVDRGQHAPAGIVEPHDHRDRQAVGVDALPVLRRQAVAQGV